MNNQHPSHDEQRQARLTAYALDQLDERERALAEAELRRSPEDQQFVEQTRRAAGLLKNTQQTVAPSASLREAVEEHLRPKEREAMSTVNKTVNKPQKERSFRPWLALAAAACLLVMLVPLTLWRTSPRLVGLNDEQGGLSHSGKLEPSASKPRAIEKNSATEESAFATPIYPVGDLVLPASSADAGKKYAAGRADVANAPPSNADQFADHPVQPTPYYQRSEKKPSQTLGRAANRANTGLRRASPKSPRAERSSVGRQAGDEIVGGGISRAPTNHSLTTRLQPNNKLISGLRRQTRVTEFEERAPAGLPAKGAKQLLRKRTPRILFSEEEEKLGLTEETNVPQARVASSERRKLREEALRFRDSRDDLRWRYTPNNEQYEPIIENTFQAVNAHPLSTFSIDVDTASYANVRRFLRQNQRPPAAAVRIEELINYFHYDDPAPKGEHPFSVNLEMADCPWQPGHRLLRVALKGKEIDRHERGASNIVFLLDVSGSMRDADKLPLVKQGMKMLVAQMGEDDRVAIVTYAGNAGLVLPSTSGDKKDIIRNAIDNVQSGGSTNGGAGIQLAYNVAVQNFVEEGVNRVILATDGDLNVGVTSDGDLVRLIEEKAASGVFLTVLGFGTGNLKDAKMEKIADKGNGMYAYIDSTREAHKVLVEQMTGSLVTIAKDVKIQIEFNPREISSYRLIGYENRALAAQDFADDKKDAGEIGAGHTVTALFELVPAGAGNAAIPPGLKYQKTPEPAPKRALTNAAESGELLTVKLRYKQPDGQVSQLLEKTLQDNDARFSAASQNFRFASSVAAFGMLLRDSKHAGSATWSAVEEYALNAIGEDAGGYRREFLDLIRKAQNLPR